MVAAASGNHAEWPGLGRLDPLPCGIQEFTLALNW